MTKFTTFAAAVAVAACPMIASANTAAELDANQDGYLTLDELQVAYPDMDGDQFTLLDLDANGALDAEEIAAATEAGMLPAPNEG
ncbi:EF-hand domain-containing protein [Sulfitobacter pseudonitzschiae]|uniref:EF-hand domain-containing protein n=1 Tax=Pseudosulfitobacter pseudonitzschiae TaxID=1402135 RepID=A0A073J7U6_9RHOB|nr:MULTISPECIES: hypothetical protein [Roseobacteraceae]KEJ97880.1 hypothetical protein SUH3_02530 [Pseudosulfitobacter pseudonitzschiae]MBM1814446.1 EF-hand domain-containing protein [Pseudosulfitobacter pseudonitzschiae]MBM1831439.1 EF-hand domain-containing protein [Pseudosulfitobacter pseudonitzschiae]MBM1836306.1 EF-hand domain-containing protein [Pseudosulfitobacter pseudonitzschiae]MBM1841152.1 EF-hand domain-containing protein [Pseudosulfitobacter pseudonitzschiae]|tara:strand:+ start:267 stop:521 length:255 start_codon:yes stop_codon:yes gene_type:complete